jgi:glutaredoxin
MRLYTTANCKHCRQAKAALKKAGIAYEEVSIDANSGYLELMGEAHRLGMGQPRELPGLIHGYDAWEGEDVAVAVEEGESQ